MAVFAPMLGSEPGAQWESFGRLDPYYGVAAREEFRTERLDADARRSFFALGEEDATRLMDDVRRWVDTRFAPRRILDYGCGVGRLLVPFARGAEHVTGLDISPSMLAEAARNCTAEDLTNVELLPAARLTMLPAVFDLVHCSIVLQHVPVRDGLRIFEQLVALTAPGGVGAVQVVTSARPVLSAFNGVMKLPFAHNVLNAVRGRAWDYPHMQMNVYPVGRLAAILTRAGVPVAHLRLDGANGGYESCTVLFQRPPVLQPHATAG